MRNSVKTVRVILMILAAFALAFATFACTVGTNPQSTMLSPNPKTLTQSEAEGGPCHSDMYITPESAFPYMSRAAVFLLKSSKDAEDISAYLTDLLHKLLLQKQMFRIVEKNDEIFNDLKSQMKYARDKKFDIIVVGEIEKIVNGGQLRQSMMSIKMRVIDPKTEVTLLYFDQCRTAEPKRAISFTDFDGLNFPIKLFNVNAPLPKQLGALVIAEISNTIVRFKE
ncbi:MAG: hypothetical protein L7F77_10990 [Candidatus Magnetominusculus sp. LBB02]|nr:hypothetical protein [Candidatus Magnetominusculus sp. LBB02]